MNDLQLDRVSELGRLAKAIRGHHDECVAAGSVMQSAHERFQAEAMLCGNALRRAKECLGHKEFGPWIAKHCEFSVRTAQRYMAKATCVSHLERPKALFKLTFPILDRWAQWLRKRVPDPQAVLTWPQEERTKAAEALEPAAQLYNTLRDLNEADTVTR